MHLNGEADLVKFVKIITIKYLSNKLIISPNIYFYFVIWVKTQIPNTGVHINPKIYFIFSNYSIENIE